MHRPIIIFFLTEHNVCFFDFVFLRFIFDNTRKIGFTSSPPENNVFFETLNFVFDRTQKGFQHASPRPFGLGCVVRVQGSGIRD
jgi:hypothetical protein